jgi:hypothetical protein
MSEKLIANGFSSEHHAYVIAGGASTREELFKALENSWNIRTKGNSDFFYEFSSALKSSSRVEAPPAIT